MTDPGYICINRKIFQHPLWQDGEPVSRGQAWIELIGLFARGTDNCRLKRAEFQVSERYLAKRWKWSQMKVHRFLEYLTAEVMLEIVEIPTRHKSAVFRVSNYDKYNLPGKLKSYVSPSDSPHDSPSDSPKPKQALLLKPDNVSPSDSPHDSPSDSNIKKGKRRNKELLSSSKTDDRLVPFRDFIFQEWKLRKGYDLLTNGSDWKQFNDMLTSSKGKDAFQLEYLQDYWLTFLETPQSNFSHPLRLFVTKINEFASKKFQNQSKIRTYSQPVYQG